MRMVANMGISGPVISLWLLPFWQKCRYQGQSLVEAVSEALLVKLKSSYENPAGNDTAGRGEFHFPLKCLFSQGTPAWPSMPCF
jgi:hypothetical protein